MNAFDTDIITYINQFSQLSKEFDLTVKFIAENSFFKGIPLMIIFWWGWAKDNSSKADMQLRLISVLLSCFFALFTARAMALLMPFRYRPIHEDALNFNLTYGVSPTTMDSWSSFPSDHAVLLFTLSAGLACISKRIGIFAILFTVVFASLPRVYLGLHYPTDIIAGAFIGLMFAYIFQREFIVENVSRPIYKYSVTMPQYFYPLMFLVTYQVVDLFGAVRSVLSFLSAAFRVI